MSLRYLELCFNIKQSMLDAFTMVKELRHLVSFDKVTLFTNILLDETINLAAEKIFKHEDCQKYN